MNYTCPVASVDRLSFSSWAFLTSQFCLFVFCLFVHGRDDFAVELLLARRKVVADTAGPQLVAGHVLACARVFEVLALVHAALVTLALEVGFGDATNIT